MREVTDGKMVLSQDQFDHQQQRYHIKNLAYPPSSLLDTSLMVSNVLQTISGLALPKGICL